MTWVTGSCWQSGWLWGSGAIGWREQRGPFLVWTDHKNLEYIRSAQRLNARQARWALFFGRFNFSLSYRPGSKNTKPDALSRLFEGPGRDAAPDTILPKWVVVGSLSWNVERRVKAVGEVPRRYPEGRLFVPAALHPEVLRWGHESRVTCHPGVRRSLAAIRQRFWWPSMARDVRQFVLACSVCVLKIRLLTSLLLVCCSLCPFPLALCHTWPLILSLAFSHREATP